MVILEKGFKQIIDEIDEGIVILDKDLNIVLWNRYMKNMTNIEECDALGKKIYSVLPKFEEEGIMKALKHSFNYNQKFFLSSVFHDKFIEPIDDHENLRQNMKIKTLTIDGDKYIIIELIDVTAQHLRINQLKDYIYKLEKTQKNLNKTQREYELLFENMNKGFICFKVITDENGKFKDLLIKNVNKTFLDGLELKKEDVLGERVQEFHIGNADMKKMISYIGENAVLGKPININEIYLNKLKKYFSISGYSCDKDTYAAISTDITKQKENEVMIKKLAYYDQLTGFYNRKLFFERMEECLKVQEDEGNISSLMMLDFDNFKTINDTYGHYAGDKILKILSQRIKNVLRKYDMVCRYGGDEFLIFIPFIKEEKDAVYVAERLIEKVKSPVKINKDTINPSVSIGISIYPIHGKSSKELLVRADKALYDAKDIGGGTYKIC